MGFINKIVQNIKLYKKEIPRVVKKYSRYLCNGHYRIDETATYVVLENIRLKDPMFLNLIWEKVSAPSWKLRLRKILVRLLISSIHVNTRGKDFQGTVMKFSFAKKEYKLFDFNKNQVLTIYSDLNKMKKVYKESIFFQHFFCVPENIQYNKKDLYLVEEYIEGEIYQVEEIILQFFERYIAYFQYCKDQGMVGFLEVNSEHLSSIKTDIAAMKLFQQVKELFEQSIPYLKLHGDCWSSNIVVSKQKVYLIDFERSNQYYFLYDFFMFLYYENYYKGNIQLLNDYFQGTYDHLLNQYFETFDLHYNKKKRKQYFLLFAYFYYLDHIKIRPIQERNKFFFELDQVLKFLCE